MSLQIDTSEGPLIISDQHIHAVVRHAERLADLTAATLDATGLFPERPVVLPAGFLLELGTVLELALWERQGVRVHLNADLPTFREAAEALLARAKRGLAAFDSPDAALLSNRVLQAWMERFAWEGPDFMHADFILGDVDEDQFAQVLADFVWQHRRELSALLNKPQ
jgi:hypothetical protein